MPRRPAPPGTDRRQQIIDAALAVFADEGYEGAKTKEIALRAGVAQGLIYFYFRDKEDLFLQAFRQHAAHAMASLDFSEALAADAAPEDALRAIIGRFLDVMGTPHTVNLLRIMSRFEGRLPISKERGGEGDNQMIVEVAEHLYDAVRDVLARRADEADSPDDVDATAYFTVSGLIATMIQRALGLPYAARFSREQLLSTVMRMLVPDSPDAPRTRAAHSPRHPAQTPGAPMH